MSVENTWVPVTPVKPPLHGVDDQQKWDGSTEEDEAGKGLACAEDTSDFVTLESEHVLVVDFSDMKWAHNGPNCCSISASSEKAQSLSQGELSSKTIPHFVPPTPDKRTNVELKLEVEAQSTLAEEKIDEGQEQNCKTVSKRTAEVGLQQEICELALDSACASVLTPIKNNENSDKDISVSVNEITKLRQYKRKHRPKVITEGKPRTVKSATQRAATSQEKLKTKRKYVRKNAVKKPNESPLELGPLNPVTPVNAGSKENPSDPKVVTERKPRTSKSATQRASTSQENLKTKRKYVRKNAVKPLESPLELGTLNPVTPEVAGSKENSRCLAMYTEKCVVNTTDFSMEKIGASTDVEVLRKRSRKTCRRSLKFDNEGKQKYENSLFKCSSNTSGSLSHILTTESYESHSMLKHTKESDTVFDHRKAGMLYNPDPSSNIELPIEYRTSQLKLQINQHKNQRGMGKIISTNHLLSSSKDLFCNSMTSSTERKEARGLKRKCCHDINQDDIGSLDLIQEFYNSIYARQVLQAEYFPKEKTDKVQHSGPSSAYFNATGQAHKVSNSKENPCALKTSNLISRPQAYCCLIPRRRGESVNSNKLQPFEFTLATSQKEMTQRRCEAQDHVWYLGSWSHQSNMKSKYSPKHPSVITDRQRIEKSRTHHPSSGAQVEIKAKVARKKQKPDPLTSPSSMTGAEQHPKFALYCHCDTYQLPPGAPSEINSGLELSTNAMVEEMKILDINREEKMSLYEEHNEMVPYNMRSQGHNALVVYRREGSIVPFSGSMNPVKKRRRYAKVDLDDETIRVWKLLMDNSNNELFDESGEGKEKRWEEERRVFSGRTDSFISKMHLIQGDRGFSQWKGSVLDSVIGVFLTQNVSDHLSSSAFMSLAAHYPLKSRSLHESSVDERTSLVVNEPKDSLCNAEDSVIWVKQISDQPFCKQSCKTVCETDHAEEDFLPSSDSSGSNTAGVSSIHEYQYSTTSYGSQKIGALEDRRSTTEINTIVEALSLGEEKTADAAISSQTSIVSEHSINSLCPLSIEDKIPCLKSNYEKDLASKDISVNGLASSVEGIQIIETNKLKSDSKIESGNDSSDEKSEGTCSTSEEKNVDQRENNDNADYHKSPLKESPCHSSDQLQKPSSGVTEVECLKMCKEVTSFSYVYKRRDVYDTNECTVLNINNLQAKRQQTSMSNRKIHQTLLSSFMDNTPDDIWKTEGPGQNNHDHTLSSKLDDPKADTLKPNRERVKKEKRVGVDWDNLRKLAEGSGRRERTTNTMDSLDWEAVRCADIDEIAYTIRERGMNNRLAERIKDFLDRLVKDHGSTDLEWLRDVPPDQVKEFLLSVRGLGLKSVECVRLLTLQQLAFPVDTNVGRIAVRLGWVPLKPLPESLQLHLLELYPVLESIQKYLWPRLCKLDQRTLYELHYQMITFGKVFCTKSKPNCNACPMRGECRHFASAFASARLALPAPEEKSSINATERKADLNQAVVVHQQPSALTQESDQIESNQQLISGKSGESNNEPIIEEPATPEPECPQIPENDIEDTLYEDPDEIPTIELNIEAFTKNVQKYMQENMELQEGSMSKALVLISPEAASIPMPKLKNISRLRTEHQVYELPDSHPLLEKLKLEKRQPDDPCFYLLAIWTPGETANSVELPLTQCSSQERGLCGEKECSSCNSIREADSKVVRGTLLIPCRTAMRGSFPLNGTYFQVNEVFADHDSSLNPIDVPRNWLWKLSRRTVYFGTSIPTIFKGLSTEEIQGCFWKGYVCVRGFDQKTRAPRPLIARLHFPASKFTSRTKGKTGKPDEK